MPIGTALTMMTTTMVGAEGFIIAASAGTMMTMTAGVAQVGVVNGMTMMIDLDR